MCRPNTVVGGVPARFICTLNDYETSALKKGMQKDYESVYDKKNKIISFLDE